MGEVAQSDFRAVGARIAQARRDAGLTQDELSDLVGVGMRQIQYYYPQQRTSQRYFRVSTFASNNSKLGSPNCQLRRI